MFTYNIFLFFQVTKPEKSSGADDDDSELLPVPKLDEVLKALSADMSHMGAVTGQADPTSHRKRKSESGQQRRKKKARRQEPERSKYTLLEKVSIHIIWIFSFNVELFAHSLQSHL